MTFDPSRGRFEIMLLSIGAPSPTSMWSFSSVPRKQDEMNSWTHRVYDFTSKDYIGVEAYYSVQML